MSHDFLYSKCYDESYNGYQARQSTNVIIWSMPQKLENNIMETAKSLYGIMHYQASEVKLWVPICENHIFIIKSSRYGHHILSFIILGG
jgi:hypothetical protein